MTVTFLTSGTLCGNIQIFLPEELEELVVYKLRAGYITYIGVDLGTLS